MIKDGTEKIHGGESRGFAAKAVAKLANLKYVLYAAVAIFGIWLFQRLADTFLNAPCEMLILWAVAVLAALVLKKFSIFHILFSLLILLLFYYPMQLMFVKSRFFFIVFGVLTVILIVRSAKKKRTAFRIFCASAALWAFGMLFTEILWPVTSLSEVEITHLFPGLVKITRPAAVFGENKMLDLSGRQAASLNISMNDRTIFAAYDNEDITGVAAIPLKKIEGALFRSFGVGHTGILGLNHRTGAIFTAVPARGHIYELSPDTLATINDINLSNKITADRIPAGFVDVRSKQMIIPDMNLHEIKSFELTARLHEQGSIESGGLLNRLMPKSGGKLLTGTWSLNRFVPDDMNHRLYVTYKMSRRLVAISSDDNRIVKIDSKPLAMTADAALDPDHNMLYLAKPLCCIEYYDTANMKLSRRLYFKGGTASIAYDHSRDLIVAGNYYSGNIDFIDRATGHTMMSRFVCLRLNSIAVSQEGRVYASCSDGIFELNPDAIGIADILAKRSPEPAAACCGDALIK